MTERQLTQEQYRAWTAAPGACPFCQCDDCDGGAVMIGDPDPNMASQPVTCSRCSAAWTAYYTITGLTIHDLPQPDLFPEPKQ